MVWKQSQMSSVQVLGKDVQAKLQQSSRLLAWGVWDENQRNKSWTSSVGPPKALSRVMAGWKNVQGIF